MYDKLKSRKVENLLNLYAKLGEMKCVFGGNEERN
jgi:hypothetical protein